MRHVGIDPGAGGIKIWSDLGGSQLPAIVATDQGAKVDRIVGVTASKPPLRICG